MKKHDSKKRVANVRAYLASIGHDISPTQGYEVVARALGLKNKHVLAAQATESEPATPQPTVPASPVETAASPLVFARDRAPLSLREMAECNFQVDVVVPVDMGLLHGGDIEELNDTVSERITGSELGLTDLTFEVFPHQYSTQEVALRVRAFVDKDALDIADEVWEMLERTAPRQQFVDELERATRILFTEYWGYSGLCIKAYLNEDLLGLLNQPFDLLDTKGQWNDAWEQLRSEPVLELLRSPQSLEETGCFFSLEELMFIEKTPGGWSLNTPPRPPQSWIPATKRDIERGVAHLRFQFD